MSKINPFGEEKVQKTAMEMLQAKFGIGFKQFDRGAERWDVNRLNKVGDVEPGWVPNPNLSLECVVEFTVNGGKGTGRQSIPASEFTQYLDSLQEIVNSGYEVSSGEDRSQYTPTHVYAAESFKMVRPKHEVMKSDGSYRSVVIPGSEPTIVSVRCTGGKGAKPMLIPRDEFPGIIEALRNVDANMEEFIETARANYEAEQALVGDAE